MTDALTYAVMKNIMDSSDKDWSDYDKFPHPDQPLSDDILNSILDKTTIKRACCLANEFDKNSWLINVRIPAPNGHVYGDSEIDIMAKKFGYIDQQISVPKSLCDANYTKKSTACNHFMRLYCDNIIKDYKKLNGNKIDYATFQYYKPECSCYLKYPAGMGISDGVPPKCVLPGCDESLAYLDPDRNKDPCELTICNASINIGNITAKEIKEFKAKINQNCGTKQPTYHDKCKIAHCLPGNCSRDGLTRTKCVDKYYTPESGKTCIPKANCQDTNCKSCKNDGTGCTVCHDGFYLKDGICTQCSTGCMTCSDDGKCNNCMDNYALIGGKCEACIDKNCITCNKGIGKCTLCKSGFAQVNGKCVSCKVGNCKTCDGTASTAETCDICEDGFYLDNNICHTCSGNYCLKCLDINTCLTCKPGYDIKKGKCVKKKNKTLTYLIGGGLSICLMVIIVVIILFIIFYFKKHKHQVVFYK